MAKRKRKYFDTENNENDADIDAQPCEYVSVGLRIEGDPDKIREFIRRLRMVGNVTVPSICWVNVRSPWGILVYARVNLNDPRDNETSTLYDRLEVARYEINELAAQLGETIEERDRLKQELGQLPKPRPYDAVLGGQQAREDWMDWIEVDDD